MYAWDEDCKNTLAEANRVKENGWPEDRAGPAKKSKMELAWTWQHHLKTRHKATEEAGKTKKHPERNMDDGLHVKQADDNRLF